VNAYRLPPGKDGALRLTNRKRYLPLLKEKP